MLRCGPVQRTGRPCHSRLETAAQCCLPISAGLLEKKLPGDWRERASSHNSVEVGLSCRPAPCNYNIQSVHWRESSCLLHPLRLTGGVQQAQLEGVG